MKAMTLLIFAIAMIAVIGAIASKGKGRKKTAHSNIKARAVLTKNEQPMYFRLVEALPEYIILCQVSFSALVDTKLRATRNTFDRKTADFVICRKSFGVVAIVELDDSSHKGREKQDANRDAILTSAGHKVLRYKRVPEAKQIRDDLKAALTSGPITMPPSSHQGHAATQRTEPQLHNASTNQTAEPPARKDGAIRGIHERG